MKKIAIHFLSFLLIFLFTISTHKLYAEDTINEQEINQEAPEMDIEDEDDEAEEERAPLAGAEKKDNPLSGHQIIKEKFIEGKDFMIPVLLCLIIGLAIAIERILNLNLKSINVNKFLSQIEGSLKSGDAEKAKELSKNTRGPIASIFYQALDRRSEGVDIVEKSIISYGSVQMGLLEKGLVWLSLFISLSPMLGFMGTVIGMIMAFDAIEAAGDINPSLVAGGIKVALLTTVAGLISAVILQIFYNYIVAKIDGIVNKMEDASITLVDMMIKYNIIQNK